MQKVSKRRKYTKLIFVIALLLLLFIFWINMPSSGVKEDGLIAFYDFNQSSIDIIGNHNGLSEKVIYHSQNGRTFAEFNGNDSYIMIGYGWIPKGDLTIISILRARTFGNKGRILSSKGTMKFYLDSDLGDRTLAFTSDSQYRAHSSDYSPYVNKWSHVAVTYSKGNATFLVNGIVSKSEDSYAGNTLPSSNIYIGNGNSREKGFDGYIDKLWIYNKVLSEREVFDHYLKYMEPEE
jgi:hypothetical protein